MITKIAAIVIGVLSLLMSIASFARAGDTIDVIAESDRMMHEIRLASEREKPGESESITELRHWIQAGEFLLLNERRASEHEKGKPTGDGVLKAELKSDVTELESVVVDRTNKSDREPKRKTRLEGFSFACIGWKCRPADPIRFQIVPFD